MEQSKHTKGEWDYDINANKGFDIFLKNSIKTIANVLHKDVSYMPNEQEAEANAKLIAEAGTVVNETGKMPRQLADENKELLEALTELLKNFKFSLIGQAALLQVDKDRLKLMLSENKLIVKMENIIKKSTN